MTTTYYLIWFPLKEFSLEKSPIIETIRVTNKEDYTTVTSLSFRNIEGYEDVVVSKRVDLWAELDSYTDQPPASKPSGGINIGGNVNANSVVFGDSNTTETTVFNYNKDEKVK